MKKLLIAIGVIGTVAVGWLFVARPEPPFSAGIVLTEPTYFAELDQDGVVLRVIVADQAFIDTGAVGDPKNWIQTWPDGSKRANYAGKGYKHDESADAFIPPKPTGDDWVLDTKSYRWEEPVDPEISNIASR